LDSLGSYEGQRFGFEIDKKEEEEEDTSDSESRRRLAYSTAAQHFCGIGWREAPR